MHWREQQKIAFLEPVEIQQDHDLLTFINKSAYTRAIGRGDVDYFNQAIEIVEHGPVDFCIYIQNSPFDFYQLADDVNHVIANELTPGAMIYLAINKFYAEPVSYNHPVSDDYHQAIQEFVSREINADIIDYQFQPEDDGSYFNFAHPLVRFYLECK
jgi:hypothetical protein